MSLCKSRLYFETKSKRRTPEKPSVAQTLSFADDSDVELECLDDGGLVLDLDSTETRGNCNSILNESQGRESPTFWDSGLGSPNPSSSPTKPIRHTSPFKMFSPRSRSPIPFGFECLDESDEDVTPADNIPPIPPTPYTPPHKKFRSLRLYDTPHTPKSLLQRASRRMTRASRNRLLEKTEQLRVVLDPERPKANVNPFTPPAMTPGEKHGIKRDRTTVEGGSDESFEESMEEELGMPSSKKLALHEINTSRYNEEFHQISKLGDGEFGSVFKCINRLDGCTYAIKKSKKPVAGSVYERNALNEVYAHAVLGKHQHVVRYYSAWAENDHMYIQNEFCNGGSMAEVLTENVQEKTFMSELDLKNLMLQVAQGIRYIHSQNLVHLDIKPGNIFIHRNPKATESGVEEDMCEEEDDSSESVTYKIGDLGHVTSMGHPQVEEGDCRYLPNEILQEQFEHLPKADVFSLALTVLEAGGISDLPKNGDEWHAIRKGILPELEHCSPEFNELLTSMVHPDATLRPTASNIVQHPVLCPFAKKSRAQLRRELNEEKLKNEMLSRQLEAAKMQQKSKTSNFKAPSVNSTTGGSRIIGRGFSRSMSSTVF